MAEDDTIEEGVLEQLVQKLTPCIERGDLDACVEEAARLADELGIDAGALMGLAGKMGNAGKHEFAYVLALKAVDGLDGFKKAMAHSVAGAASQNFGNAKKAETNYLKAIEADPKLLIAHSGYAKLLTEHGRTKEAAEHHKIATEINQELVATHNSMKFLQRLAPCIERGELDVCVEEAVRLAEEMGIDAPALLGLAGKMGNAGKHEFAYVLVLKAVDELDGSEKAMAYSIAGAASQNLGDVYKAETNYLKAIEADPNHAMAHNNYALLLAELNRTDEAEEHYLKAIGSDPNYAAAHYNYASLLVELNRKGDAEFYYLKAIKADPNYAVAYNNYAILLVELNRTDEAECYYLKAIGSDPNCAAAHYNYALLLDEFNRTDEAENHYLKAIDSDSTLALAHSNYAHLLKRLNRIDEAENHYLKAIEANSKDPVVHYNYANLLKELNKIGDAEYHYLESIKADPNDAASYNNYANLLRECGKFSEAENEVRHALQIAQDDSLLQDILPYAHGTLGDILADEKYYKYAKREYQKALSKSNSMHNSSISEMHNNLGWVYAKMEKYGDAKEEFKKARVLDSMNVTAIRNYRAADRMRREKESDISSIKIFLGSLLLLLLIFSHGMFFIGSLSEALFVVQSTIFLLLIFVLFDVISKVKVNKNTLEVERSTEYRYLKEISNIEFERSTGVQNPKNQSLDAILMAER